jgi:Cu+-exporting ATPase
VRIIGTFGIYDAPKPEAKSTILALKSIGMDVWICTGDHYTTAKSLAKEVGIDETNIRAGVRPDGKAELVTELQQMTKHVRCCTGYVQNRKVAFVGDGINDSVALSQASVGIALGSGTSIALDAADIILTSSDLHDVFVAIHLSRVVFNRIMYNFFWATAYNIFSIPLAAGVVSSLKLPPTVAGMMMPFSSISVVLSSLLLKFYKKPSIDESGHIHGKEMYRRCIPKLFLSISRHTGFMPLKNNTESDLELA